MAFGGRAARRVTGVMKFRKDGLGRSLGVLERLKGVLMRGPVEKLDAVDERD